MQVSHRSKGKGQRAKAAHRQGRALRFALLFALIAAPAAAQGPGPRGGRVPDMQAIAAALGVECSYCHGERGRGPGPAALTATGKPRFDVAREMIAMTEELNTRIQRATEKDVNDLVRVDCVTCHRGVAIPRQMSDILIRTTLQQTPEAAATIYRDLRTRYYGKQAYDFSEEALLGVADRLVQGRPAAAIALADLNLEFNPKSSRSYLIRGIAQTRQIDNEAAVASFKKSLELDPDNGVTQGWLIQTEQLLRRR
jgi:tetratricopeptide (TPR) repeat protein